MKKCTSVYVLAFIFFNQYSSFNACIEIVQLDARSEALKYLLTDGVRWLNNDMITFLAVNKEYEKLLCDTASYRKGLFGEVGMSRNITWYKYGSMCGNSSIINSGCNKLSQMLPPTIQIVCYSLAEGNNIYRSFGQWDKFHEDVRCLSGLRINHQGDLYMYGWEKQDRKMWDKCEQLVEYSLAKDGAKKKKNCGLCVGGDYNVSFSYFKLLPELLKAFLNSSHVYDNGFVKTYHLDGVIIPEFYKDSDEPLFNTDTKAFYQLPELVQDAIKHRYDWQPKDKEDMILSAINDF